MKKILPVFISLLVFLFTLVPLVSAQVPTATPTPSPAAAAPTPTTAASNGALGVGQANVTPVPGQWVPDAEVTFVGKTAARSGNFLDWSLQNYNWASVSAGGNALEGFWVTIRNIVYGLLILFVFAGAVIIMLTRGRNITIWRFVVRFVVIVLLVTLSYAIVQFFYQVTDIVQDFFLRNPNCQSVAPSECTHPKYISQENLLNVAFDYQNFEGYKLTGSQYEESAWISLLLIKLTAATYYVLSGILIVRKIVLWFFIILSPVFPLLLFFNPLRSTAKIWAGEFFRWLLYAPLFAIFLKGLVEVWHSTKIIDKVQVMGIPLPFNFTQVGTELYPTAVNILLGGPGQQLFYDGPGKANSVNLTDTFALYVVSLVMLWVAIILPFILLKMFLDHFYNMSFTESNMVKQIMSNGSTWFNRNPSSPVGPTPPAGYQPTGVAKAIPFTNKINIPVSQSNRTNINHPVQVNKSIQNISEIMKLTNLSIPTMRDIAKFETASLSKDAVQTQQVTRVKETLQKIANPQNIHVPGQRVEYTKIQQTLSQEKQSGNPVASAILTAANVSAGKNQQHAAAGAPGAPVPQGAKPVLPTVNRVQTVSIDDYEAVKKMWTENYEKLDVPQVVGQQSQDREQWVASDVQKINQAINLLTSPVPEKQKEGMNMVSNILPFLLVGGFSQAEVIAYLKAKLEAAKAVEGQLQKKQEEEDTTVTTAEKKQEKPKEMTMEAQKSLDDQLDAPEKPKEPVGS